MRRELIFVGLAVLTATSCAAGLVISRVSAQTPVQWTASAGTTGLPHRSDIVVAPISAADPALRTSPAEAVAAAESVFGFSDGEVDRGIGIVRGAVSIIGDPMHTDIKSWTVCADVSIRAPGPVSSNYVYRKLCVVVDATTGKYVFGYSADPVYSPIDNSRSDAVSGSAGVGTASRR